MDRYEFLTGLHEVIKPRGYLEIGVQTGASLVLAKNCTDAVGVDPDLSHLVHDVSFATLAECTSDEFFQAEPSFVGLDGTSFLDLVFIDGAHLAEQVWYDFLNSAANGHERTVYAFDDVLPRNNAEASRQMIPGDWTGDVWKATDTLWRSNDEVNARYVDTFPTGIMVILGTPSEQDLKAMRADGPMLANFWSEVIPDASVPDSILTRKDANDPYEMLEAVSAWLNQ